MTNDLPKPKMCKDCSVRVRVPGSSYCRNCRNWRAKGNYQKRVAEERRIAAMYDEYGDLIGPDGYTDRQREAFIAAEEERIANDPKFDHRA